MKLVGHNEIVYNESKIIQVIIDPSLRPDRVTDYLEFIKNYANYKKWFLDIITITGIYQTKKF